MTEPECPQKRPYPIQVESGKEYHVCMCGRSQNSQCVTETTREADWVLESLQQLKMDLLHFVDASEVLMQQENVTVHMALSKIDKR